RLSIPQAPLTLMDNTPFSAWHEVPRPDHQDFLALQNWFLALPTNDGGLIAVRGGITNSRSGLDRNPTILSSVLNVITNFMSNAIHGALVEHAFRPVAHVPSYRRGTVQDENNRPIF